MTARPNRLVFAVGLAVVQVLDRASDALERRLARRAAAGQVCLPYPEFDACGAFPPLDESGLLLLQWVPDGLPDDLRAWMSSTDGGAS